MSYTEIVGFDKNGEAFLLAEIKDAFRGGFVVWTILKARYFERILEMRPEVEESR